MKTSRNLLMILASLIGPAATTFAQDQPPAKPMTTRWTKQVTPNNVWPEYPRPCMVRPEWTNLNGSWDHAITARNAERPERWDGKILVPFCVESLLGGVKKTVSPEQALWYRRDFDAPDLSGGKRLLLHFGAVDWRMHASLNGKPVGEHDGGHDPFYFDVTE
ncbi:MAG: hypothetical protein N2C14_09515, partial [Planctomycetales bacterium]